MEDPIRKPKSGHRHALVALYKKGERDVLAQTTTFSANILRLLPVSNHTSVTIENISSFKEKALAWANQFSTVCLLDSNDYPHHSYKTKSWFLAVDAMSEITCGSNAFEELKKFKTHAHSTVFGFLSYDLKNQVEKLSSNNFDGVGFPDLYFFKPRYMIEAEGNKIKVNRNYPETFEVIEAIEKVNSEKSKAKSEEIKLKRRTSKKKYLENVEAIKQQIVEGDFYELNYCNEFYTENAELNTVATFQKLNEQMKAPFSCFFKTRSKFLLCASPERFLKREGHKLIAQPIKGTIRKGKTVEENEALKQQLKNDKKERAENVMIVDLVRNDLAKSSKAGSVHVGELFGVYEFKSVNQMISTVTSEILPEVNSTDVIKSAFPMGSMTGAPKVCVMQNIEKYEDTKRGLFSGSVGYIKPNGDFDFNVVIRSILYNASQKYLSVQAGGAITYDSVAEKEYEEVVLKAKGLFDAIGAELSDG